MQGTKNRFIGTIFLIAPAVAMFVLFHPAVGFVPAELISNGDPMAPWAAAIVGLVPGYLLFKRVVTVRGHEWHRLQAIKKLSKHYKNESLKAWNEDSHLVLTTDKGSVQVGNLTQNALQKMQGKIGDLMMDNTEAGVEIDSKSDVKFLADLNHVNLASSRIVGANTLDETVKKTTRSDIEKSSVMDNLLDWIALKLSNRKSKSISEKQNLSPNDTIITENVLSLGASNYEQSVSNSWHCRSCGETNSINSAYCELCGSSR